MLSVVIADDELNIVELIQHMLDPQLADVAGVALNGMDAYEVVTRLQPDLLITDVRMPGYSGLELIEKVKVSSPETDIIVISGYREFDYLQSILKFGVQEFLLKPVDSEELNGAVRRMGQKRGQAQEHACYVADMESNLVQSYQRLREEYVLKLLYEGESCLNSKLLPERLFSFQRGRYNVLLLKADCDSESDDAGAADLPYVRTLLERYRDTIINAFRSKCYDIACSIQGNKVYFIFNYSADQSEEAFWNLSEFNKMYISDMLVTENYKYGFLHFTLGVGISVSGTDQIGESFRSALCAVGNRLNPCSGGVIDGKSVDKGESVLLGAEMRERLTAAIVTMDVDAIMEVLTANTEKHIASGDYYRIYDQASAVLYFARNIVLMQNLMGEEEYAQVYNAAEALDNCFSVKMVNACLKRYFHELVSIIREIRENRASKPIRLALEYMQENFAKPITLQSVAETIFYSSNYFSNAFKKQTGKTFLEYLTELRMDAAQDMLRNSTKSIGEIAHEVGYSDEKYFSKLFAKTVGIKPNEYRKFYS